MYKNNNNVSILFISPLSFGRVERLVALKWMSAGQSVIGDWQNFAASEHEEHALFVLCVRLMQASHFIDIACAGCERPLGI